MTLHLDPARRIGTGYVAAISDRQRHQTACGPIAAWVCAKTPLVVLYWKDDAVFAAGIDGKALARAELNAEFPQLLKDFRALCREASDA